MDKGIMERVDVAVLERELRDLWKQMAAKTQQPGEPEAVTRACVHNLAVYAPGERSESELSPLLSDLMVDQPGRVILMLSDFHIHRDTLNGWVNAQCHRTAGHRQQVCSEQVVIRAGRDEIRNLSSLVIPLLVPDLPVFFWWREDLVSEWNLFGELAENADRVIVDSVRFSQTLESLRRLIAIVKQNQSVTSFSDLNWNRLTPWRQMIAGFFDHNACKGTLNRISALDIQAYSPSGVSAQSLMLVAWLAARLKWQPVSRGSHAAFLNSEGHQVKVRIFTRPPMKKEFRGLATVTLHADQPPFTFHLTVDPETHYLRGVAEMKGTRPADRTVRLGHSLAEECLATELAILGPDRIYNEMLHLLEQIL